MEIQQIINDAIDNDAIDAVTSVISEAKHEVLISSGHLDYRCYERPEVLSAIRDAKARNVRFYVLTGPKLDEKSTNSTKLLRDDIYLLEQEPVVHFTLADGEHFRLESRDPRIDGIYRNEIRSNDPLNGNYLRYKFFDALSRALRYTDSLTGVRR